MKKLISSFILLFVWSHNFAQEWVQMLNEPGHNFYEIQASFNSYFKDHEKNQKGNGYKQFKRWEHYMEPRVYPSGDLSLVSNNWKNFSEFKEESRQGFKSSSTAAVGTWTAMGPMGAPTGMVFGTPTKTGRDNFITFHPTIPTTFWVGAASGGLWKTTNGGSSWTTNTDNLAVIGCSDLAIDPTNPNIMYLATGDGEAGDTYCIGVLKSTDGGLTWNATGLSFTVNQTRQMRRLIIDPTNPQILLAASNIGIHRTTDGGVTWTTTLGGNYYDVEFKPGDPLTVYAGGNNLRMSTDGGVTFSLVSSGVPTSGAVRLNIAVTPANPNYVYVLRALASNNSYGGLYQSTNSGGSFVAMSTSPDVLANACSGVSGNNAQGWYDLSCAVSPSDPNEVVVGGVNVWKSINGGSTWVNIGCWNSSVSNPPFIHADIHELEYTASGTLYSTNDGGVFYYTGTSWTDITAQRNITQVYKIGLSSISPNLWITGHQDNGTSIYNSGAYTFASGGDGMDCFIDRTNNNNMFCSAQYGSYRRSSNGGSSWSSFISGLPPQTASYDPPWLAPWKQDPTSPSLFYAGYSQLYYSLGGSWTQLAATGGGGYVVEFAIAPSNNQVIYVIHGTSVRKTVNGGQNWTNISNGIPGSLAPTFITIDPNDENHVWVTCSGYSAGSKVFQTTNGGTTWMNISYNLPNLPANCSVYQPGTNDRIYVGMDVGVYTKDNSSNTWTLFNNGLPNVQINDMEISPASPTLLRAATYGRGVYQTELIQPIAAPTTSFVSSGKLCAGMTINFTDLSSEAPTSWAWSSSPNTGVVITSANSQNPSMTFANGGTYVISLTASNGFGAGTVSTQTITMIAKPSLTLTTSTGSQTLCLGDDVTLTADGAATYTWEPLTLIGPNINFIAGPTYALTYTVNAISTEGCENSETLAIVVSECTGLSNANLESSNFDIFPNPTNRDLRIKTQHKINSDVQVKIVDVAGKIVLNQTISFKKDQTEYVLDVSHFANGVYFLHLKTNTGEKQTIKFVKE